MAPLALPHDRLAPHPCVGHARRPGRRRLDAAPGRRRALPDGPGTLSRARARPVSVQVSGAGRMRPECSGPARASCSSPAVRPTAPRGGPALLGPGNARSDTAPTTSPPLNSPCPNCRRSNGRGRRTLIRTDSGGGTHDCAWVAELSGDCLKGWPQGMRLIVRKERPHPGAPTGEIRRWGPRRLRFRLLSAAAQFVTAARRR